MVPTGGDFETIWLGDENSGYGGDDDVSYPSSVRTRTTVERYERNLERYEREKIVRGRQAIVEGKEKGEEEMKGKGEMKDGGGALGKWFGGLVGGKKEEGKVVGGEGGSVGGSASKGRSVSAGTSMSGQGGFGQDFDEKELPAPPKKTYRGW